MEAPGKTKLPCSPPPPPSLPQQQPSRPTSDGFMAATVKRKVETWSVTKQEIERFWRRKQMVEENHLLSASKAAARIRARSLTVEDYRRFEETLNEGEKTEEGDGGGCRGKDQNSEEIRIGIKDWWTKSKYAYLNQPAVDTKENPRRTSSYTPNSCSFYKPPISVPNQTAYQLGVF